MTLNFVMTVPERFLDYSVLEVSRDSQISPLRLNGRGVGTLIGHQFCENWVRMKSISRIFGEDLRFGCFVIKTFKNE